MKIINYQPPGPAIQCYFTTCAESYPTDDKHKTSSFQIQIPMIFSIGLSIADTPRPSFVIVLTSDNFVSWTLTIVVATFVLLLLEIFWQQLRRSSCWKCTAMTVVATKRVLFYNLHFSNTLVIIYSFLFCAFQCKSMLLHRTLFCGCCFNF